MSVRARFNSYIKFDVHVSLRAAIFYKSTFMCFKPQSCNFGSREFKDCIPIFAKTSYAKVTLSCTAILPILEPS